MIAERFAGRRRCGTMAAVTLAARRGPVERTLGILELVAERGGATARELSVGLGLPLPTVYRLAKELVDGRHVDRR